VSATNEELRVKILDAKKSETELRAVRRELEKTTGVTSSHSKQSKESAEHVGLLSRGASGLKSALGYSAGLLGLGAVGYGLKDVVQGGIEAQEQQALLQNALKQTGQTGGKHLGELNAEIERSSSHGGFAPVEEIQGIAQLERLTKSSTGAIKLNREAIDLARGAHMSYSQALSTTERIQTGQVGRLQKYLGIIQPVKYYVEQLSAAEKKRNPEALKHAELLDKQATAQEANRRVLERYGAATKVYGNTAAGAVSNAKNAISLLEENLGKTLLPTITEVAKGLSSVLVEIEEGRGVWGELGHDASVVAGDLKGVWEFFEKNKTAAKLLKEALPLVGFVVLGEEGLKLKRSFEGLLVVQKVSTALGGLSVAEEGAEATTGALGLALGLLDLAAPVAAFVALYEAIKHWKEITEEGKKAWEDLQIDLGMKDNRVVHVYKGAHPTKATTQQFDREQKHERDLVSRYVDHPASLTPKVVGGLSNRDIAALRLDFEERHKAVPGDLHQRPIHVHVDLDGREVGRAVAQHAIRDPVAARRLAEATTKHVQGKAARE
jgi:hypothetical protein